MDYTFLNYCRTVERGDVRLQEDRAYESLITFLFRMKLWGKEKARQIDEYDGESLFGNTTLYPGNIYVFLYKADKPTLYDDGRIRFEYYDNMPIVLVTHVEKGVIRGVNLNLCNKALRALVLNTLHNLDLEFFDKGGMRMAGKGHAPISKNVTVTFLNPEKEKAFYEAIRIQAGL